LIEKFLQNIKKCGRRTSFNVTGVRVGVAPSWNKLVLRRRHKNPHAKSEYFSSHSFRDLIRTDRHG